MIRPIVAPPATAPIEPAARPSFSVLIAAYQAADTIGDAVASALEQTVPAHEVIVCDDGSTDDTEGALAPYRDRIIYLRRERNGGAGAATNTAAGAATGEFVVTLDADDVYLPERIEALGELAMARPDLDLLSTDAYLENDGQRVGRYHRDRVRFVVGDQRLEIVQRNFIFHAAIRRRLLRHVGGWDESLRRTIDWDILLRLIFAGARAGLVDAPLACYRLQEGSLMSDRVAALRGAIDTLDKAAHELDLTVEERAALARARESYVLTLALEETRVALLDHVPGARRRALAVAAERRYPWSTRVKAGLAALVPQLTRPPASAPGVRVPRRWRGG